MWWGDTESAGNQSVMWCTPHSHSVHLGLRLELRPRGTELGLTALEEAVKATLTGS